MTQSPIRTRKQFEQNQENEDRIRDTSAATECDANHSDEEEELKDSMVTPKGTNYLFSNGEYSPEEAKVPLRVQSVQSLLGLVGLEGHEESEGDYSTTGISAVTEEQEIMDIVLSPSTPAEEGPFIEDATCNTTPPGSVQGPGILSLSPPRLTTYSTGSVTSASVTENFVLQPRPVQSVQRQNQVPHQSPRFSRSPLVQQHHVPQESPRFSRSPLVQQPQPLPRSRPPRAPHHPSTIPGCSNSVGGGPVLDPRAVIGTGPDSLALSGASASGGGHTRTSTDATNFSFLSSLTDVSGGEFTAPRRRTLSWDNNGNSRRGGPSLDSKSLGGQSTTGSILQPILLSEELEPAARPPTSISASNLRKASPAMPAPAVTTPTVTTPIPLSLSQNTPSASLLAPSSLPSRANLHPLIQQLQNVSHARSRAFISPASESKDGNNVHPHLQKLKDSSPHTASTSATSPFAAHLQDEKKDDDSSRSLMQQKSLHERKSSDYASFSSSFCSSKTIRLQKKATAFPGNTRGNFERQSTSPQRISEIGATGYSKHSGEARFNLEDILNSTKECNVETDIVEGIERNNLVDNGNEKCSNDFSWLSDWPYFLLAWAAWAILNLGGRGLLSDSGAEVRNIVAWQKLVQFSFGLGAAAVMKRKLSKKFFEGQVIGHYRDELIILRNIWIVLNDIASLLSKKEREDCVNTEVGGFHGVSQHIDSIMAWNTSSSFKGLSMTRENFIESSQIVYERLVERDNQVELSFESLCEVAKFGDGSNDRSKIKILSELLCPSRQGQVSKLEFVKSTDSIFKTTTVLIANINNASQICDSVDHIVNVVFYTIALILVPSIFGVDINTLILTLLGISVNVTFMICFTSAESLKGIVRLVIQKSYDIGDRVYFVKPEDTETKVDNGPPSGGWIVEKIDLYNTTVRQGITGERSTFSNGSDLLTNSIIVNWKRSHRSNVTLSMEFAGKTGRDQIHFFRRQIFEWVEDRPWEWIHLDSFRMVDVDIHQHRVKYDIVLRHRESWHNYAVVQDSKSDILVFLHELRKSVEA